MKRIVVTLTIVGLAFPALRAFVPGLMARAHQKCLAMMEASSRSRRPATQKATHSQAAAAGLSPAS